MGVARVGRVDSCSVRGGVATWMDFATVTCFDAGELAASPREPHPPRTLRSTSITQSSHCACAYHVRTELDRLDVTFRALGCRFWRSPSMTSTLVGLLLPRASIRIEASIDLDYYSSHCECAYRVRAEATNSMGHPWRLAAAIGGPLSATRRSKGLTNDHEARQSCEDQYVRLAS